MVDQIGNVDTQTDIHRQLQVYRQTDTQADKANTDRQTWHIQTGRLRTYRQADLAQTDRQTKAYTDRQTRHIHEN